MEAFRHAARKALRELGAAAPPALGHIERANFDVRVGGESELVSLRAGQSGLVSSCSCGRAGCAHVQVALRFISGVAEPEVASVAAAGPTASEFRPSMSAPLRKADDGARAEPLARPALSEVLDDLVTAAVRTGITAENAVSVQETIDRLLHLAGTPLPLGVGRFVGRLRYALETADVDLSAEVLAAASALASDLCASEPSAEARARVIDWIGAPRGDEERVGRVSDRIFLEVAREWVHGTERAQIERRYLVDLGSGDVYREQRVRRARGASVGPCPRLIDVGLAEVDLGIAPRCIRLLQYTSSLRIERGHWDSLLAWTERDFGALVRSYREKAQVFFSLAEPFALVSPATMSRGSQLALVDAQGTTLLLDTNQDPGAYRRFEELTLDAVPVWVAGRLVDRNGHLMLVPLSTAILRGDKLCHERL